MDPCFPLDPGLEPPPDFDLPDCIRAAFSTCALALAGMEEQDQRFTLALLLCSIERGLVPAQTPPN
jgi:hypothetical protein